MPSSNENLSKEEKRRLKSLARAEKESRIALDPDYQITILCVRFGNRYGKEYVERLRNMVNRHLSVKHEIVCLTDDHHPIDGVRSIYQANAGYAKGWWHKVHMFDHSLPINGRILYFDLDIVIHNNINKLATYQTDQFVGIHDFNRKFHPGWKYLNSSVMAWNHRSQNYIWEKFKENPREAQRLQGDQDWIWKLGKQDIKFWPKEWIQSYKWEIRGREELVVVDGKRNFKTVNHSIVPEQDCCVTVFHGDPKPQDVQDKFVVDNWH